jgi:large subunit ribosomal protein L24
MATRIKKGDVVKVLAGKDRGKTGKVLRVDKELGKASVEGVNVFKKHSRPKRQGEKGEIVMVTRPMQLSNLMVLCATCGKPTRVGTRIEKNAKSRICKQCGASF